MVLYVDIGNKMLVKSDGLNRLATPDHPQVFEGSQEVFEITFFKNGAVYPINLNDTFTATLDNNFIHTDDIMASSSTFTIVNASAGRVNIPMLFTAASFTAKLAGLAKITAYLDIKRYLAGETVPETLLQDTVSARASIAASEGSPETGNPEYYNSSQVDALIAGVFDRAEPYDFTTTSETGATLTFSAATLGVDAESCDFEVIQVLESEKKTVTGDAAISRTWTSAGYVVTYAGGWPAGSWQLRAGKVKGDAGRDGMVYDRETMSGVTIAASATPKTHYYTAHAGDVLVTDWSAVAGKDATIWLKLTMPSTPVSITLPSDITKWKDDFGNDASAPDMSTAGTYWIFIHKDAAQVWATGKKVS